MYNPPLLGYTEQISAKDSKIQIDNRPTKFHPNKTVMGPPRIRTTTEKQTNQIRKFSLSPLLPSEITPSFLFFWHSLLLGATCLKRRRRVGKDPNVAKSQTLKIVGESIVGLVIRVQRTYRM